jgi:predicted GNAT family N-acyltransferase
MSITDPVVAFISPPGDQLCAYNRRLPASQQPPSIPRALCDAMTVRDIVFVKEQKAIPLAHHLDPDDARSYHWVVYAPASELSASGDSQLRPVGTIRLCSYPHDPHPRPGMNYTAPGEDEPVEDSETFFRRPPPEYKVDRATSLYDGKEPYLKLGRLCVVKEFRGKKLSGVLIQAALKWASENPHFSKEGMPEWKGLVCVHAQERAVTTWQRNGFVIDEGMGTWVSTGMNHYGLFHRVVTKN